MVLYALALIGSYVLPTAVGGNVDRLGALGGGAGGCAACSLGASRRAPTACCSCSRRCCSTGRPTRRSRTSPRRSPNPSVERLLLHAAARRAARARRRLRRARPARIEVVATADHWEARCARPARDDRARLGAPARHATATALFYEESTPLTPARYRAWLSRERDLLRRAARRAARLLGACRGAPAAPRGRPGLPARSLALARTGACSRCSAPRPLAQAPARADGSVSSDSFTLYAPRAGRLHGAGALHPLLGARERQRLRGARPGRLDRRCRRAARAACTSSSASRSARVFSHGAPLPLSIV